MDHQVTNVIGTECLNTNYDDLTRDLQVLSKEERTISVDFTNVHIVTMRRTDPEFAKDLEVVDFFVPDSQILYFTVRLLGGKMSGRVYGPTFMEKCVPASREPFTHYFLGGNQETLDKLVEVFRSKGDDIKIVGSHHGYFGREEDDAICAEINELSPDFIWVGLGTPLQQKWIALNKAKIRRGIVLAVGFAFDVNAGTKKDAPPVFQKLGLTWLFRLCCEPRRLFGRYLKYNTLYLWFLFRQLLPGGRKKFSGEDA